MKAVDVAAKANVDAEVSALISKLHETGQRLEELTAGEIDTVADSEGRTFVLRNAQEHLRSREAEKQAAILNVLPANIALIGAMGVIVSVNDSWRAFGDSNMLLSPGHGVGVNYLSVCDAARGEQAQKAHAVASGIRSVLDGSAHGYATEYACDSPDEARWFLMTVTPLAEGGSLGAVVMHLDITARRTVENSLRDSEASMAAAQRIAHLGSWELQLDAGKEIDANPLTWSDEMFRIAGHEPGGVAVSNEMFFAQVPADEHEAIRKAVAEAIRTRQEYSIVHRLVRPDGEVRIVEEAGKICYDDNGVPTRIIGIAHDVTERIGAARQLAANASLLQQFIRHSPAAVAMLDRDLRYLQTSDRWAVDYDLGEDSLVGRSHLDVFPDIPPEWIEVYRRVLAGAVEKSEETPFRRADGTLVWLQWEMRPWRDAGGGIGGLIMFTQVITARKLMEKTVRQQQAELRVLLDLMPAMIWFKDTKNRILKVNRHVADAAGKTVAEIEGKESWEIYPDDAARFYQDDLEVIVSGREKLGIVEPMLGPDGGQQWVQTDKVPYFDRDGKVAGIAVMARDITEVRNNTDALERSAQHLRDIFDGMGPSIFVALLSPEGILLEVNKAPLLAAGLAPEDVVGKPFADTPWWSGAPVAQHLLREAIVRAAAGEASRYDTQTVGVGSSLIEIDFSLQPLRDRDGKVVFLVPSASDITERKQAEAKLTRLNRGHAVLSLVNGLIVRAKDRDELFREVCRIAVGEGGFRMAWIGVVDREAMRIVPLASDGAGAGQFVATLRDRLSLRNIAGDEPGPAVSAVRDNCSVVIRSPADDPRIRHWEPLKEWGITSIGSLPLAIGGVPVAVLTLAATGEHDFDPTEMKLLEVLANDLAYAIDHIEKQARFDYLAFYDALTGLANQTLFVERLQTNLISAPDQRQVTATIVLDIERFKQVDDGLGREAGDDLLRQVAARLVGSVGQGDSNRFARLGADRFAVYLPEMADAEQVGRYIEQDLNGVFRDVFAVRGTDLKVSVKMGIAMAPDDGMDAATLLHNAESALKKAKGSGERFLFFSQSMTERVFERLSMEGRLRRALANEEFVLHYQPKVGLLSGLVRGAEALIRWQDPRSGLVPPLQFIPILEETGLIHDVGRWAMRKAVDEHLRWRDAGYPPIRIAVNVSPLQLRNRDFAADVVAALAASASAGTGLELEITESLIMEDVERSIDVLKAIRAMGVTIALDDFGTGFSSLAYLSKLPVDTLKIDRSFVTDMVTDANGLALVSTIITLAHSLRLKVVAEGVETDEQSRMLRLLRCDEIQGWVFSKAVPAELFEEKFLAPRNLTQ